MNAGSTTALLTDHYELTMLEAALKSGVAHKKATFELFTRSLPNGRGYGVVAGTERVLDAVEDFQFSHDQINYLKSLNFLSLETLDYLRHYKFTGTITGYLEGETYFAYSPIMTVQGTFGECVLLETVMLSILNHDSAIAAAASRMFSAAKGTRLIDMGTRRAHEYAAVDAARAAYIAGFDATSNLAAGFQYGIPTTGTAAHAFTLAHDSEVEAFQAQVDALGEGTTLLVDTYDTEEGIQNAIKVGGKNLGAIRIDSGDLLEETIKANHALDDAGLVHTGVVLSSDLDEYSIRDLVAGMARVRAFGVGTRLVTGSGHPTCGMVYKLVEIEDENGNMRGVAKKSSNKGSRGGRKKVLRLQDDDGLDSGEIISTVLDYLPEGLQGFREVTAVLVQDGLRIPAETDETPIEAARRRHRHARLMLPREHFYDLYSDLHDKPVIEPTFIEKEDA